MTRGYYNIVANTVAFRRSNNISQFNGLIVLSYIAKLNLFKPSRNYDRDIVPT